MSEHGGAPGHARDRERFPRNWREVFAIRRLVEPAASIRTFAFLFLTGLVYAQLMPHLPLEEELNRAVARIMLPALHPFYPSDGQRKVTVLQVDDDDLAEYHEKWPLSYAFHRRRLLEIARLSQPPDKRPRAILIDVLFLDERTEDPGPLRAALCQIADAGVRVYLASVSRKDHKYPRTEFLARGKDGRSCATEVSVTRKDDRIDYSAWEYPISSGDDDARMKSAAVAIYEDLDPRNKVTIPPEKTLALIWGTKPYPLNMTWMHRNGEPVCRNSWRAAFAADALTALYPQTIFDVVTNRKPLCPYNRALPVRVLQGRWLSSPALDEALDGNIVIYAVNLQSATDMFRAPLHGQLSGPHLHAMALDNLLSLGDRAKRYEKFQAFGPWTRGNWFTVLALAVLAGSMTAAAAFRRSHEKRCSYRWIKWVYNWRRPRIDVRTYGALKRRYYIAVVTFASARFFVALILYALLSLAIGIIGYSVFDLGPTNWMKYAAFLMLAHFLHVGPWLESKVCRTLEHIDDTSLVEKERLFVRRARITLDKSRSDSAH